MATRRSAVHVEEPSLVGSTIMWRQKIDPVTDTAGYGMGQSIATQGYPSSGVPTRIEWHGPVTLLAETAKSFVADYNGTEHLLPKDKIDVVVVGT